MQPCAMNKIDSRPIALIGLPGAGKTTIGKNLARLTKMDFFDTDQVIESKIKCSIKKFFNQAGEAAFRELESKVIDELSRHQKCIISTGGGAVLRASNRNCLKEHFYCIYLRATPHELFRRLRNDQKRPLLQVQDPLYEINNLYLIRDPLYLEVADLIIDTGRPNIGVLAASIVKLIYN